LRVLQENEIKRVGSSKSMKVDVRVVAATHRNLEEEVKAGRFREDLFYRISVITLRVPPLRKRREDIPLLALHFLQKACRDTGKQLTLSSEALTRLRNHEWSGNVRELENTIEHAVLHTRGKSITEDDLPVKMKAASNPQSNEVENEASKFFSDLPSLDELEKRYLLFVLESAKGNKTRASEILQIDRRTLYRMAERFGINLEPEK
jgi:DNA-binding NtrC family response regulator